MIIQYFGYNSVQLGPFSSNYFVATAALVAVVFVLFEFAVVSLWPSFFSAASSALSVLVVSPSVLPATTVFFESSATLDLPLFLKRSYLQYSNWIIIGLLDIAYFTYRSVVVVESSSSSSLAVSVPTACSNSPKSLSTSAQIFSSTASSSIAPAIVDTSLAASTLTVFLVSSSPTKINKKNHYNDNILKPYMNYPHTISLLPFGFSLFLMATVYFLRGQTQILILLVSQVWSQVTTRSTMLL